MDLEITAHWDTRSQKALLEQTSSIVMNTITMAILETSQVHQVIAFFRSPSVDPSTVYAFESHVREWITLNVAGPDAESAIAAAITGHGPIDVLVNTAGFAIAGPLGFKFLDSARAVFKTNSFGAVLGCATLYEKPQVRYYCQHHVLWSMGAK
ncbi:uncharacterized protein AB675_9620 [Cyphellophora attinorum]|uniref:Uncharacterized protein n=1 Tax=Cyphellophora attinorum TaxID=1664694 RepID=A0A0N1HCP6_9EURO|nr:uncharacterized protein AB675_9620 [Phialophora attinorum]KPI42547.1 hypothetical protein AB675_9620 [Phialophora attinorum]